LPAAAGAKVTLIVQFAPGATDAPQLLDWAKSPVTVMLFKVREASPLLVTVTA